MTKIEKSWITEFVERQINARFLVDDDRLALEYHFVDSEEGRNCLNRVFDRLFDEVMRRRKAVINNELFTKK